MVVVDDVVVPMLYTPYPFCLRSLIRTGPFAVAMVRTARLDERWRVRTKRGWEMREEWRDPNQDTLVTLWLVRRLLRNRDIFVAVGEYSVDGWLARHGYLAWHGPKEFLHFSGAAHPLGPCRANSPCQSTNHPGTATRTVGWISCSCR